MIIGILKISLHIPYSDSLKTKRMVLQSLKTRLRNKFNVSCIEIDHLDKWQMAGIAVVNVGQDKRTANSELSCVINFMERFDRAQLLNYEMELI